MPKKNPFATFKTVNIRPEIHKRMKDFCNKKGYKVQFFVEFCIAKNIPVDK